MMRALAAALVLFTSLAAHAAEVEPEEDAQEAVAVAPPILVPAFVDQAKQNAYNKALEAYKGREFPAFEYLGADALKVEAQFVHDVRLGIEKLYQRDYKGSQTHFVGLAEKYPGTALAPMSEVLIAQAQMMENFDFRQEAAYLAAHKRAVAELETALQAPGNEAWENFLMAMALGLSSIHQLRHEEYTTALSQGQEAMKYVESVKKLAPDFHDIRLAEGLFAYWSSSIALTTKAIPFTEDKRVEGITQIKQVEGQGTFFRQPASIALALIWLEEGRARDAVISANKVQRAYPGSVIAQMVLGRVHLQNGSYPEAERAFKQAQALNPENQRVNLSLGMTYMRWGKLTEADAALDAYLAATDLSPENRGQALYVKGRVAQKRKDTRAAKKLYEEAWKEGKVKKAKERLEKID